MNPEQQRVGVLAMNVGTPDAPRAPEVRRYLREFLGDPRVLDMNRIGRSALLNFVILPFRPRKSAAAYAAIWGADGSPLLHHTVRFSSRLQDSLGDRFLVLPAMRYGRPSIASALERCRERGIDRIVAFPLFPQYASSTTGTGLEELFRQIGTRWNVPSIAVVPPFWSHPDLAKTFADIGRPMLENLRPDHVLFSFHGLPERHVRKSDDSGAHCLAREDCCARMVLANRNCYRAQCYRTADAIAAVLGLQDGSWGVSFQSRLGRTPWIRPYTDETVQSLAARGVRRLAVFCPAFVADCIETIEEIGMQVRDQFLERGGEELRLVPSLNASDGWVKLAARLVRRAAWPEAPVD